MTDVARASADRYALDDYSCRYLYAEWADVLFPERVLPSTAPGLFYRRIGELAARWSADTGLAVARIADIGGATGRMSFELARTFGGAEEVLMAEPSAGFCRWARRILRHEEFDGRMPVPGTSGRPDYELVGRDRLPEPVPVVVVETTAGRVGRPSEHFDLVTCLNVADRVPDPRALVRALDRLVRPSGLLVLASPHHYEERFTPPEHWIDDLAELLDPDRWDLGLRRTDIDYGFQTYDRGRLWYSSQVLGAVKREA
ncbi:class I SAM-dependent methyltransferase [Spirillospora sp. NPDC050679]